MENESIKLAMLKEIKDDLKDFRREIKEELKEFRKEFCDHKNKCEPRFRQLEDNDKADKAIKNNHKDWLSYAALIISCLSGILIIILNADKVSAMLK